ncbi:hypothetical protein CK203_065072 [Vitis vinifera]|uniref:Uncharacterized protein n=1 Tax=Vitis vinifera TaxID=29760 RepID=A0A438FP60_VITVI|nr:hypothetical protein CK203_065072 [Vitis vinifera]
MFSSKLAKLEFPKYSGDDTTEWFTRVDQFFEYQGTLETQKVLWLPFIWNGRQINGGSGCARLIMRKGRR